VSTPTRTLINIMLRRDDDRGGRALEMKNVSSLCLLGKTNE
jgi:hypothetical protein